MDKHRFAILIAISFMLNACRAESGPLQTVTPVPATLVRPPATAEITRTPDRTLQPFSTAVRIKPTPLRPSDEENEEAVRILQGYSSNFPVLTYSRVFESGWGCVGTRDYGGVLSYDTYYSFEEVRQAFIRYFQEEAWEYVEDKPTTIDPGWKKLTTFRAYKEEARKPCLADLLVHMYGVPASPTESAASDPDDVNYRKIKVVIFIKHLEGEDSCQNREIPANKFQEICPDGVWLYRLP